MRIGSAPEKGPRSNYTREANPMHTATVQQQPACPCDPPAGRRPPNPLLPYVRKAAKGYRCQARIRVDGLGCVHLGLYKSKEAAARAVEAFKLKGGFVSPMRYLEVFAELHKAGLLPTGLLPQWVRRSEDGGFVAERRTRGGVDRLPQTFDNPADAFLCMLARVNASGEPPTQH